MPLVIETFRNITKMNRIRIEAFWHFISCTSWRGVHKTPWAQRGPWSETWDLCCHWWEGPSDIGVGKGPGRWERLLSTNTKGHEGKAINNM